MTTVSYPYMPDPHCPYFQHAGSCALLALQDMQFSLLPKRPDEPNGFQIPGIEWYCVNLPSAMIGGDFYILEHWQQHDHITSFIVGDVSGNGGAAALQMAATDSHCKNLMRIAQEVAPSEIIPLNPALMTKILDHTLYRVYAEHDFCCMFLSVLDSKNKTLTYTNAGHYPEPILIRGNECIKLDHSRPCWALGMNPREEYPQTLVQLYTNDILVLATDGILSMLPTYEMHELAKTAVLHRNEPAKAIARAIYKEIMLRRTPITDDILIWVGKVL